ncbi:MAG: SDR family NAD(P)-dependent oxidoreductase [Pseudomonadota bacterium]|nr:SDR family NAD(P)-dependent oxidoreductase [Pseudomonadota bacterium]
MFNEALVTGAGGALGRVVVQVLRQRGMCVHAVYHHEQAGEGGYHCDLSSAPEVQKLCEQVLANKRVAIVHCAGGFIWNKTADYKTKDYDYLMSANFRSAFLLLRYALPLLRQQQAGGRIVFVSSAASLSPNANNIGMGVYSASKSALNALLMSTCAEVRGEGININAICPTIIDTPRNRNDMPDADRSQWVSCEKIAQLICVLLSKDGELFHNCFIPM